MCAVKSCILKGLSGVICGTEEDESIQVLPRPRVGLLCPAVSILSSFSMAFMRCDSLTAVRFPPGTDERRRSRSDARSSSA